MRAGFVASWLCSLVAWCQFVALCLCGFVCSVWDCASSLACGVTCLLVCLLSRSIACSLACSHASWLFSLAARWHVAALCLLDRSLAWNVLLCASVALCGSVACGSYCLACSLAGSDASSLACVVTCLLVCLLARSLACSLTCLGIFPGALC